MGYEQNAGFDERDISPHEAYKSGWRAWGVVLLLTAVSIVSLLDRQIITILAVDIKAELGLTDAEIGLVYGTVFGVFYALFAIPLGRLADGWIRTKQIAASILVWSLATVASGLAGSFGMLAAMRGIVAAGESGVGPASNSIVGDLFPARSRAAALAVLMSAATLGIGCSMLFGGLVMGWWKASFPGGIGWFGLSAWRATFIFAAAPGMILMIALLFMREPVRGLADGVTVPPVPHPFRGALQEFLILLPGINLAAAISSGAARRDVTRLAIWLILAIGGVIVLSLLANAVMPAGKLRVYGALFGMTISTHTVQAAITALGLYAAFSWISAQRRTDPAGFAMMWSTSTFGCLLILACSQLALAFGIHAFVAPYAIRTFHVGAENVGPQIGLAMIVGGFCGTIAGGFLGDRAFRKSPRGRLWIMLGSVLLTIPAILMTLQQSSLHGFVISYGLMNIALAAWYPCCIAGVSDIIPASHRGTAFALLNLSFTILGQGLGPYLVGTISDATGSLGTALNSLVCLSVPSLLAILCAMRSLRAPSSATVASLVQGSSA